MTWVRKLEALGACNDAVQWSRGYASIDDAWSACPRGDWMLWLAGKAAGPPQSEGRKKKLVLAACDCARLALPIFEKRYPGNNTARNCINTAERWALGNATYDELLTARRAAAHAAAVYAAAVYAAATREKTLADCAEIVRQHYPTPPLTT